MTAQAGTPEQSPAAADPAASVARDGAASARDVLRIVLVVVACAIGLYLFWRVRTVVRLSAISLFLALAIIPVVDWFDSRTRVPRAGIILLIFLCLTVAVVLIGVVVVPSLVKQVGQLSHNAPQYARELRGNSLFRHYDNRYHLSPKLVRDARGLPHTLARLVGPLKDVTVSAFSLVGQLVTVLALTFLLLLHGRSYVDLALSLTGDRETRYRELIIEINRAVASYMLGNIVISVLATLATWIVLSILGVPYALSLGFVVGFFDLIPLVGATIGAIVVAFATVTVSFPTATIVWVVFIVLWQRFEDYVVQPFVYGRALHVNPIVTIVSVIAGAELLGVLGALLAIPTAAAIQIILRTWWSSRDRTQSAQAQPAQSAKAQPAEPAASALGS